jgi:maltooligosyltrehalose trehalohydrolase
VGAELVDGGVHFRVWAPKRRNVAVVLEEREESLSSADDGYFEGFVRGLGAGALYRFHLDDERETYPDPASRYQPEGPHGPSMVVDPAAYRWSDAQWRGVDLERAVAYEMHFGTFTPEGTYRSALAKLPHLRDVGITIVEVMPVNEFPGRFGWGYDGVDLWAPAHIYGTPDHFRAFVDAAHAQGLGVILDVVYNHLGPDGCYLSKYSDTYFSKRYKNEWGEAVNYDDAGSAGTREFVSENVAYWIEEFHLDGVRIDATQSMIDTSDEHVIALAVKRAREAANGRRLFIVGENEPQEVRLLERDGLDALWNDDWHHAAVVALTGRNEAYYTDYLGRPQEFVSMATRGFLYQGQRYKWQKKRRGTRSDGIAPHRFVCYLENHDQLANSGYGRRIHQLTSPGRARAMKALLLLAPQTPMLFQGEEFAASSPFLYFADHKNELAQAVAKGRREFLAQFPSLATPEIQARLARPDAAETFTACKLDWSERERHGQTLDLHRDLLRLRRELRIESCDGAVLAAEAFVLRLEGDGESRLLIVNLGADLQLDVLAEPLLAGDWTLLWSSESPKYGGSGTAAVESEDGWRIPGHAAVLLTTRSTSASPDR